ncbi:MAG: PilW family protein [Pseudomonadota bacterium]
MLFVIEKKIKSINFIKGVTIVELMISMVLGLLLINSVMTLYLNQRSSYYLSDQAIYVNNDARFISDLIGRDIRAVGDFGCTSAEKLMNVLNNTIFDPGDLRVISAFQRVSDIPNTIPGREVLTALNPVSGTPILMFKGSYGWQTYLDSGMATNTSPIKVKDNELKNFSKGDVVAISNCKQSSIFEVTNVNLNGLSHDAGVFPTAANGNSTGMIHIEPYAKGADIVRLDIIFYVIGNPSDGRPKGLYRISGTQNYAQLITDKLDNWNVKFKLDLNQDMVIDNNLIDINAMSATDWRNISSVYIEAVLRSSKILPNVKNSQRMKYYFNGEEETANDNHFYSSVSFETRLRNFK